jgi:hypothetical protein
MITRVSFDFLQEQRDMFTAQKRRPPRPDEEENLRGPVLKVDVVYRSRSGHAQFRLRDAVAMIDTGADRTHIEFEFVEQELRKMLQSSNPPTPALPPHWITRTTGWDTDEFALEVNGVPVPTRSGRVALTMRNYLPGFEHVLIGRDLLKNLTLCCSIDTFSLMGPPLVPIRLPNDPCCR